MCQYFMIRLKRGKWMVVGQLFFCSQILCLHFLCSIFVTCKWIYLAFWPLVGFAQRQIPVGYWRMWGGDKWDIFPSSLCFWCHLQQDWVSSVAAAPTGKPSLTCRAFLQSSFPGWVWLPKLQATNSSISSFLLLLNLEIPLHHPWVFIPSSTQITHFLQCTSSV